LASIPILSRETLRIHHRQPETRRCYATAHAGRFDSAHDGGIDDEPSLGILSRALSPVDPSPVDPVQHADSRKCLRDPLGEEGSVGRPEPDRQGVPEYPHRIRRAEAEFVRDAHEGNRFGIESHEPGRDPVGLDGLIAGYDETAVHWIHGRRAFAFPSDHSVHEDDIRLEEVEPLDELAVYGVIVVALPEIVGYDAHRVLESERHLGVQIRLELRQGNIAGLSRDDGGKDPRYEDFLLHARPGQDIAVAGLFLQGDEAAAPVSRHPVYPGSREGEARRRSPPRGFDDGDG
jgi:hypothetical protein